MKFTSFLRYATGFALALLLSSCASTSTQHAVRFREQATADVVVRFSSWDLITINKPDTREAGFLPLYKLAEAQKVLASQDIPHGLAVVICGLYLSNQQQADLQSRWASILGGMGYQRVVFLRCGFQNQVNGLTVLNDIRLPIAQLTGG